MKPFLSACCCFIILTTPVAAQTYRVVHISNGTGFFVSQDGYLLTNAHVVDKCSSAKIQGERYQATAEIIERDISNDVALLKVNSTPPSSAVFRDPSLPMTQGEHVVVVGHPLGKPLTTREADFIASNGPLGEPQWLRFSNSVFQGNSGGPLLDSSGQVIGVIMAKSTTYRHNQGNARDEVVANADVAIQPYVLEKMFARHGIRPRIGTAQTPLSAHRVEDVAKQFVVHIRCQLQ